MEKFKNIEILRFLFAISIVLCHFGQGILNNFVNEIPLYANIMNNLKWSYLPVDYFFVIAGFFLFLKTDFTQSFVLFVKKKLFRFMPVILFTLLLTFISSIFTATPFSRYENLFLLFNIQNVGLTFESSNVGPSWFVSSLFWTMCFYFYLYNCVNKKSFNLITACLVFGSYALWIHNLGLSAFENVYSIFNIGMARAFAGVGAGYFILMLYKDNISIIQSFVANWWQKLLISGLEVYIFIFILYYTCLHKTDYNNPMMMVVSFIILFILFLFKKGYLSQLLENNFSVFLGQYAFSIFITHYIIKNIWKVCVCNVYQSWVIAHPVLNLSLLMSIIIFGGVFTYHFVEKPCAKYLKEKL